MRPIPASQGRRLSREVRGSSVTPRGSSSPLRLALHRVPDCDNGMLSQLAMSDWSYTQAKIYEKAELSVQERQKMELAHQWKQHDPAFQQMARQTQTRNGLTHTRARARSLTLLQHCMRFPSHLTGAADAAAATVSDGLLVPVL